MEQKREMSEGKGGTTAGEMKVDQERKRGMSEGKWNKREE